MSNQGGSPSEEKKDDDMDWGNNSSDDGADGGWGDGSDGQDDWGDEDDWGGDQDTHTSAQIWKLKGKQMNYKLLDGLSLVEVMNTEVRKVAQHLELEEHQARALLQMYEWNKDVTVNKFFQAPTKALASSGVVMKQKVKPKTAGELECSYCLDDVPAKDCDALICGHQICKACWQDYLNTSTNTQDCVQLTCPHQCSAVVPPFKFKQYLKTDRFARYERFCAKNFVEHSKLMMWCPAPKCNIAAQFYDGAINDEVKCSCGFIFCGKCNTEGHNPSPCDVAEMWRIKASSESENIQWILARTKKCPKCSSHIEKNQGCNHMTCVHCKYEFCWLCKGDWSSHGSATGGYYKCNIYEKQKRTGSSSISKEEAKADAARNALEKYTFYLTRYDNHLKALRFAEQTLKSTEARMDVLTAKYKWKPN